MSPCLNWISCVWLFWIIFLKFEMWNNNFMHPALQNSPYYIGLFPFIYSFDLIATCISNIIYCIYVLCVFKGLYMTYNAAWFHSHGCHDFYRRLDWLDMIHLVMVSEGSLSLQNRSTQVLKCNSKLSKSKWQPETPATRIYITIGKLYIWS